MKKFIKNILIKLLAKMLKSEVQRMFSVAIYRRKANDAELIAAVPVEAETKEDAFSKAYAQIAKDGPESFCYIAWQATEFIIKK
jgi:hypothetical protein